MEGKTHGKDIMLLCKCWHDEEKYKTTKDALLAYYNKYYDEQYETISYGFINRILLKPAIEELLTDRYKYLFVSCLFDTDGFDIWKFENMKIKDLGYDEELYYRLTKFIRSLIHFEDDNTLLIDTNDYFVTVGGNKVLSENII